MSDHISPDLIETAKSRDARFRIIDEGFAIQAEMRNSPTILYLLRKVTKDSDDAVREMAGTSPLDSVAMARHLVKIQTLLYIQESLLDIQKRAEMMAREVQAEDIAGLNEY